MKRLLRVLVWLVCLLFCLSCAIKAKEIPKTNTNDTVSVDTQIARDSVESSDLRDPAAIAELKRATDFLTSLPRFHIKASVVYDVVQEDGRLLQFEKLGKIWDVFK